MRKLSWEEYQSMIEYLTTKIKPYVNNKKINNIYEIPQQFKHLWYHIMGVNHKRVEDDPTRSFSYYMRIYKTH